ncbi:hypothetical protein F444_00661 [Phytophthora nicotianae P1976]|uniref:Myb/SANT-like domain-containing protein n=1 Tax=Phytophthora nicotianae P1976 TaxID=1317066 RepID=A0A081B3J1_PHYNI|nr:hypothetical protein F444_00661 [Phytophthora nicotianae P1976]
MVSEDPERSSWDSAKDAYLVEAMTQQAQAGKRAAGGFKKEKEAWTEALAAFNTRLQTKLSRQQIKSRLTALKGIYTSIKVILDAS